MSAAQDFPRPMGVCSRFVCKCAHCDVVLSESLIPWHVHRQPVVVSHGLCTEHYEALIAQIDAMEVG